MQLLTTPTVILAGAAVPQAAHSHQAADALYRRIHARLPLN
jgi:hypothetical protein